MLMLRSDLSKTKQNRIRKDKAIQTPPMPVYKGGEIQAGKHEARVLGHGDNRRRRIRRQLLSGQGFACEHEVGETGR